MQWDLGHFSKKQIYFTWIKTLGNKCLNEVSELILLLRQATIPMSKRRLQICVQISSAGGRRPVCCTFFLCEPHLICFLHTRLSSLRRTVQRKVLFEPGQLFACVVTKEEVVDGAEGSFSRQKCSSGQCAVEEWLDAQSRRLQLQTQINVGAQTLKASLSPHP